jgi:short-subunit dehydrogenase
MARRVDRPLVLVTGASSGIGLELAKIFAAEGHDVVANSEDRMHLDGAAATIRAGAPAAEVIPLAADLSQPAGPTELYDAVRRLGRGIDVLVNNAGVGVWGNFADTDIAAELAMIQLNAASVVHLTKLFLPEMVERGSGKILITASQASLAPLPLATVYGATKAFVFSFAEGLRDELSGSGVTVTALLPGPTDTNWFKRAGAEGTKTAHGDLADPAQVARAGYDALMAGDDHVVTPFKIKVLAAMTKFMPERLAARNSRLT